MKRKNQWKKPLYIICEIHEISVTSDYPPLKEQKYTYPPIPDKKNSEKRSLKKIIKKIEKMVKKNRPKNGPIVQEFNGLVYISSCM